MAAGVNVRCRFLSAVGPGASESSPLLPDYGLDARQENINTSSVVTANAPPVKKETLRQHLIIPQEGGPPASHSTMKVLQ